MGHVLNTYICCRLEEQQSPQQLQPIAEASPTLHIAPLSCGLRIVKSGGDNASEDLAAAAGSPRAPAGGAAASAESPSECSAGAAAMFPDDAPHTSGVVSYQQQGPVDILDPMHQFFSPSAASADGRAEQQLFQLPLFQQQQQQQYEDKQQQHQQQSFGNGMYEGHAGSAAAAGLLLESLAQAAEEVERRAGSATAAHRPRAPLPPPAPHQGSGFFAKTLDYKSCDHIMCLTKDMARHLFPQPPHTSAGKKTCITLFHFCTLPSAWQWWLSWHICGWQFSPLLGAQECPHLQLFKALGRDYLSLTSLFDGAQWMTLVLRCRRPEPDERGVGG